MPTLFNALKVTYKLGKCGMFINTKIMLGKEFEKWQKDHPNYVIVNIENYEVKENDTFFYNKYVDKQNKM